MKKETIISNITSSKIKKKFNQRGKLSINKQIIFI
jgi:hypothetical protein